MIKIDWQNFMREYVWFGWQHVPASNRLHNHHGAFQWNAKWYWLGWAFAFWPVRKRFEGTYPKWYAKLFGFNQ